MGYTSYVYLLVFLGATFLAYTVAPLRFKWCVLLLASAAFYVVSSRFLTVFLLAATLTVYLSGLWLGRVQRRYEQRRQSLPREERKALKQQTTRMKKRIVALMILLNFGMLFFLKYYNFFGSNANWLFGALGAPLQLPQLRLALPLGISFYTLQAASYVIDIYRGKIAPDRHLGRIALFLCFFPQITEGPIGRYDQLAPQLYQGHRFDYRRTAFGLQLIVWGLFKKLVIADRANMFVNTVFDQFGSYSGLTVLIAMLLYTLQIYAEFSGVMDIVTGSAQLFGVNLSPNFRRPFFARSVDEFWRRWHITLGAWLRDYVFYSVSLSKPFMSFSKALKRHNEYLAKLLPVATALFCVWFGCGIWHGASWKYVAYGMYYYLIMLSGLALEPLFGKALSALHVNRESRGYRFFQVARTFLLVNVGMLLFRAESLTAFFHMLASIFTGFSASVFADRFLLSLSLDAHDFLILGFGVAVLFAVDLLQERGIQLRARVAQQRLVWRWALYFAAIFAVILFGAYGYGYDPVPLIYAQF